MIRKNILSLTLLSILGLSHAAEVENLKTISYLNEPLRLHADVIGEGEVKLAAPTEYLRLNHMVPTYDLSINVLESGGKRELILTTTEAISVPALTLLLEGRDSENRKQLFELPILLDFKPDPAEETVDNNTEIIIDGVAIDANEPNSSVTVEDTDIVELADVPAVTADVVAKIDAEKVNVDKTSKKDIEKVEQPVKEVVSTDGTLSQKADEPKKVVVQEGNKVNKKVEEKLEKTQKSAVVQKQAKEEQKRLKDASDALTAENNSALIKRYGPVSSGETLWSIANKVRPTNTTPQKMIEIIKRNNPSAFTPGGVLKANVVLIIPGETKKVQSNFVKEEKQENKKTNEVRIGFIYELPAPPVAVKTTEDIPASVSVPVVEGENKENVVETPIVKTVKPSAEVDADKVKESVADSTGEIAHQLEVAEVPKESEVVKSEAEEIKAVQQPVEPVAEVKKTVPKRPAFIMPEPVSEPSIIELIFDNIMYIGAGAAALVLAVLGLVVYRRKKDDGQDKAIKAEKPKKEKVAKKEKSSEGPKKKSGGLFGKKKKPEPIEEDIATAAGMVIVAEEISSPPVEEWVSEELSDDLVVEIMPEENVGSVTDLDFDLSSLELVEELPNSTVALVEQPDSNEAFLEDLDFDLSPLEQVSEEKLDISLEGLSFDTSLDKVGVAEDIKEKVEKSDDYTNLDFDLSFAGLTESQPAEQTDLKVEDSSANFDSLEIDLSGLDAASHKKVEEDIQGLESGFGENNPLFAQKDVSLEEDNVDIDMPSSTEGEESAYVSFSDIMKTAETASVSDDTEADKPFDFSELLEESEGKRGLESLLAESAHDDEATLDFSFVAETEDVGASQSFLDSLDTSEDTKFTSDVIGDSVKDNIAMTEESMSEMSNMSSSVIMVKPEAEEMVFAEPVITEEPKAEEVTFVEPVITEEPKVEEATFVEPVVIEEPVVEEMVFAEPVITEEPEVEELAFVEPVITEEPVVEALTFAEPVIAEEPVVEVPKVQVQEKIVEKEVIVEKIVEVEKPVTALVEATTSESESSEIENESEQIKLELAVAYMDFDKNLAKPLLEEVVQGGNDRQVAKAKELLAQID